MGIDVVNVSKSIGVFKILENISFSIKDGEFISLTGKSGSGKSTLLYIISSLDKPTTGSITISGHDISVMPDKELHLFRNHHVGFVFQFHHLLPELTALDNVLLPARKTGIHNNPEVIDHALNLIHEFGIGNKKENFPGQLSGGERQRVALARALVMNPSYLFADEPTGNLDSKNGEIVMNLFSRINQTNKTTIIMVTHDPDFAAYAKRQIVLVDGRLERSDRQKSKKL